MSGAAAYLAQMQGAVAPILTDGCVPHPLRREAAAIMEAADMDPAAKGIVPLILDMEAAADALALHAKRLRATLAEVMAESGFATVRAAQHVASVTAGRAAVVITDPAAIPPDLMRAPPPAPDKAAISKLLREGHAVPGATLGNAGPQLTIRSKDR